MRCASEASEEALLEAVGQESELLVQFVQLHHQLLKDELRAVLAHERRVLLVAPLPPFGALRRDVELPHRRPQSVLIELHRRGGDVRGIVVRHAARRRVRLKAVEALVVAHRGEVAL